MKSSILHWLNELESKFKYALDQITEVYKNFYTNFYTKTEVDNKISNVSGTGLTADSKQYDATLKTTAEIKNTSSRVYQFDIVTDKIESGTMFQINCMHADFKKTSQFAAMFSSGSGYNWTIIDVGCMDNGKVIVKMTIWGTFGTLIGTLKLTEFLQDENTNNNDLTVSTNLINTAQTPNNSALQIKTNADGSANIQANFSDVGNWTTSLFSSGNNDTTLLRAAQLLYILPRQAYASNTQTVNRAFTLPALLLVEDTGGFQYGSISVYPTSTIDAKLAALQMPDSGGGGGGIVSAGTHFISTIINTQSPTLNVYIYFSIGVTFLSASNPFQSSFLPVKPTGNIVGVRLAVFTSPVGVITSGMTWRLQRIRGTNAPIDIGLTGAFSGWTSFTQINSSGQASGSSTGFSSGLLNISGHVEGDGYVCSINQTTSANAGAVWQCEYSFVTG